tara:strand:- start:2356 stop:3237 length:882 start_codon:yes stop_codon:yes gene_type:complete
MLNWNNWNTEIIKLLENMNNTLEWEKVFNEFYINDVLTDPSILLNKKEKLDSCYKIVDSLDNLYKNVIHKLTNINITKTSKQLFEEFLSLSNNDKTNLIKNYYNILKYKEHEINLYPINPFNLGISSYNFEWLHLFNNKIPNNFKMYWNTAIYSDFQIKISPNSNIYFTIFNNIVHRILKYNSYTIYIFEKNKNISNISNDIIEIKFKTEFIDKQITENNNKLVYFSFNQDEYNIKKDNINCSIYKIELLLHDLKILKKTLIQEIEENNNNINIYNNKFNIKKKNIQKFLINK